mgnify:CR=1 FL=1
MKIYKNILKILVEILQKLQKLQIYENIEKNYFHSILHQFIKMLESFSITHRLSYNLTSI